MPSGFMPNGIVMNHSSAGSFLGSAQYAVTAMNASMVPFEAASKQSSGGTICPPGKTSIRNRPPLVSSTILASCWAGTCPRSIDFGQAVDIRHCTFGWATTLGTSTMAAAITPLAVVRKRRRLLTRFSLDCDELVVGALGDVIPGTDERLELRERRVDFPGHRRLLGFFAHDLGRQLAQIAQDRQRQLHQLDRGLELGAQPLQRDSVLRVVLRGAVRVHGGGGVIERALPVHRERLVGLAVEPEPERAPGLVPARVVVVPRGLVQPDLHVVVRPDPLGGVDDSALERGVDLAAGREDRRAAGPGDDLAAQVRDAHLQSLVVRDG